MALPVLNSTPKYEMIIPSTGKRVRFRPYLVKEEKVLMIAFESGDIKNSLNAVVDVIMACLEEGSGVKKSNLTTFDVEYMLTQIRAKSVGESSEILVKCKSCDHKNPIKVDLEKVSVVVPKNANIIKLTDDISIQMNYPSYKNILEKDIEEMESKPEMIYEMIVDSIECVMTENERISAKDESREDLLKFIDSLTAGQSKKLYDFFKDIPQMKQDINYVCESCESKETVTLQGMSDFF